MEELKTIFYLEELPESEAEIRWERLLEIMNRMENRHWCGMQGFGQSFGDFCPICEKQRREKDGIRRT